jgi:hypothetical protein
LVVVDPSISSAKGAHQKTSGSSPSTNDTNYSSNTTKEEGNLSDHDLESQSVEYLNPLAKPKRTSNDRVMITSHNDQHKARVGYSDNSGMEALGLALCVITGSTVSPQTAYRSTNEHVVALPSAKTTTSPRSSAAGAASKSANLIKSPMSLTDCFVTGSNNTIYSAQEIFGWKASNGIVPNSTDTVSSGNSTVSRSRQNSISNLEEGGSLDDECVVCLTEKKDIALLPCR